MILVSKSWHCLLYLEQFNQLILIFPIPATLVLQISFPPPVCAQSSHSSHFPRSGLGALHSLGMMGKKKPKAVSLRRWRWIEGTQGSIPIKIRNRDYGINTYQKHVYPKRIPIQEVNGFFHPIPILGHWIDLLNIASNKAGPLNRCHFFYKKSS